MANTEHLKKLKQGVVVWNNWRNDNPNINPNLSGADLSEPHFGCCKFQCYKP